jgi:signal transduction histidine kinase
VGIGGMRQRIKEHGGELVLRNTHPGTIVEVVIPINSVSTDHQAVPAAIPSQKLTGKGSSAGI